MRRAGLSVEEQLRLLDRVRSGDESQRNGAVAALLDDFRRPALAAIHKTLAAGGVGQEHAEEVLQAAVLKFLVGGVERFRSEASPRSYFVRIAIHAAVDCVRLFHREVCCEEDHLPPAAPGPFESIERRLQARQEREALERCLEELSASLREAIRLYYFGSGEECESCARKLGVSRSAFEQRLCRGRLSLAECLRRKGIG